MEERAEIGIRELLQCRDVADSACDRVYNRRESLRNFRDHAVSTSADLLLKRFARERCELAYVKRIKGNVLKKKS